MCRVFFWCRFLSLEEILVKRFCNAEMAFCTHFFFFSMCVLSSSILFSLLPLDASWMWSVSGLESSLRDYETGARRHIKRDRLWKVVYCLIDLFSVCIRPHCVTAQPPNNSSQDYKCFKIMFCL